MAEASASQQYLDRVDQAKFSKDFPEANSGFAQVARLGTARIHDEFDRLG